MEQKTLEIYNVQWDTPSKDHNGSMPLGNGETGINLWVEKSGDLVALIGRTDSFDEINRLCKIGRIRIKLFPQIKIDAKFSQILQLAEGSIKIVYKTAQIQREILIWVDAHYQVIRFEMKSSDEFIPVVHLELWRTSKRKIEGEEAHGVGETKDRNYSYPDTVMLKNIEENELRWYHQNPESAYPHTLKNQYLEGYLDKAPDPLLNRIFGASIRGEGFQRHQGEDKNILLTAVSPNNAFVLNLYTLTLPNSSEGSWSAKLLEQIAEIQKIPLIDAFANHKRWWQEFWDRSWIIIESNSDPNAFEVTRCYILQRFIQAAGGRGNFPIEFNGSIFTVNTKFDPDYRRWGGGYWFQNTRLPYWPMLSSKDWDMMHPFFKMYQDVKSLGEYRNKVYHDHPGWFFPETMSFWGAYLNENFGWVSEEEKLSRKPGDPITNEFIRWHYNATLEFLAMLIDYYEFTQSEEFLKDSLLPLAEDFLGWWFHHWKRDEKNKLLMDPSQSLETWWNVKNPTPDIAGLRYTVDYFKLRMKNLDLSDAFSSIILDLSAAIPDIPFKTSWRGKTIAPAELMRRKKTNCENPELYPVFPFKLYGVYSSKEELAIAQKTFKKRGTKAGFGWSQDDTQAAHLGMVKEAKKILTERVLKKNKGSRFPVFWGPNYDWIPDQDHGSNLLMALQSMLLQWDREKIYLLPAWPKDWDVEFNLWGPHNTQIKGSISNGKLKNLEIIPKSRQKDVIIGSDFRKID